MIQILSMNIRGMGDASKLYCLRDLFATEDPIIILCQETLCRRDKAIKAFLSIQSGWYASTVDATGHSGGMITFWNPYKANIRACSFFGGMLLSSYIRGIEGIFNIINLYAPYQNRITF